MPLSPDNLSVIVTGRDVANHDDARAAIAISFEPPNTTHPSGFAPVTARGLDAKGYGGSD